jgi:hypothetical protein
MARLRHVGGHVGGGLGEQRHGVGIEGIFVDAAHVVWPYKRAMYHSEEASWHISEGAFEGNDTRRPDGEVIGEMEYVPTHQIACGVDDELAQRQEGIVNFGHCRRKFIDHGGDAEQESGAVAGVGGL